MIQTFLLSNLMVRQHMASQLPDYTYMISVVERVRKIFPEKTQFSTENVRLFPLSNLSAG